jgi:hypothetical protein
MNGPELEYRTRLTNARMGRGKPAEAIVFRRGHELWRFAGNRYNQIEKLMENFWHYGHTHRNFGWVSHGAGNGGGRVAEDAGGPLLRGEIRATNCGGFGRSMMRIAQEILGFTPEQASVAGVAYSFLTFPRTSVIDAYWRGNVRTISRDFSQLKAFKFTNHAYLKALGRYYDVSTNTGPFVGPEQFEWTRLGGIREGIYSVERRLPQAQYGLPPQAVVTIETLRNNLRDFPTEGGGGAHWAQVLTREKILSWPLRSGSGWPTYLLCSVFDLPQGLRP